jgi:hypothetical protein
MLHQLGFHQAINLLDVPLVQSGEDRALVREILIYRADANPGDLGDAVSGNRLNAAAFKNPDDGVKNCLNCLACPALLRLPPPIGFCLALHGMSIPKM